MSAEKAQSLVARLYSCKSFVCFPLKRVIKSNSILAYPGTELSGRIACITTVAIKSAELIRSINFGLIQSHANNRVDININKVVTIILIKGNVFIFK